MGTPTALRAICGHDSYTVGGCVTCEAADEIEALQRENERLKKPSPKIDRQQGRPFFAKLAAAARKT